MASDPQKPLTDDQKKRLRIFRLRVQDLRESGLAKAGPTTLKLTLNPRRTADGKAGFEGYDEDQFRAFIATLRQFIMNDEHCSFYSICNIIEKARPQQENLITWVRYARDLWKKALQRSLFRYYVSGGEITVEKAIQLLLYGGGLIHTRPDRYDELEALPPGGKAHLKFMFQNALPDLYHALNIVDRVIYHWLDAPEEPVPPIEQDQNTSEEEAGHGLRP